MNGFSKIVAILIGVIMMFIIPTLFLAQKQDAIVQVYISTITSEFVDAVKNTGTLTNEMYIQYRKKLDASNNIYKIEMTHAKETVYPRYNPDTDIFQNDYKTHYYNYYEQDIIEELDKRGAYHMGQGDFFTVKVYNRNKTYAGKLMGMIYGREPEKTQIYVTYGGEIRDENY